MNMFYTKKGMPEESEIVLCTVTNILPHSVFAKLDEYGKTGMIHISEVSPGRIRNLNDYVTVGKKVVCKVLRLDLEKGHIDLSLRRVNEGQRREKVNQLKKEQKAEKIIEIVAKQLKEKPQEVYDQVTKNIFQEYEYLHECFEDVISEQFDIKKLKLPAKIEKPLQDLIKERMPPPKVSLNGVIKVTSYKPDGVNLIKAMFKNIIDDAISCKYLGGGAYNLTIITEDYDDLNKIFKNKVEKAMKDFRKQKFGEVSFEKV